MNEQLTQLDHLVQLRQFLVGRKVVSVETTLNGSAIVLTLSNGKRVHVQGQFTLENAVNPDVVDVEAKHVG